MRKSNSLTVRLILCYTEGGNPVERNDRKKELNEEKCLDDAIRLAKNKRAMTRNIMNMLSGTTVTRAKMIDLI